MRTIIHIGQHKTATTTIQHFLRNNREDLYAKKVYYPDEIAGFNHPSHYILNVYALDENRFSTKKEALLRKYGPSLFDHLEESIKSSITQIYEQAKTKKCETVVFSNEGLYLLNSVSEYSLLYKLVKNFSTSVEVVCCFRDVASYKLSYSRQLTKGQGQLSEDPDSYRYLSHDSWLFDYARKKKILEEVFDATHYFKYNKDNNLLQFLLTIGLHDSFKAEYRLNVTI